jgi:hypothetical protein
LPCSVIRSDGPLGEPVAAVRVTPPQPKLADGTLVVLDDVPDEVVVPPDDVVPPDEVVVPPDDVVVPPDDVVVPPDVVVPVDVLAVDVVPEDGVAVDAVAPSGEEAAEDPPPPHPAMITDAAAAAVKVERIVMAIAASCRSW